MAAVEELSRGERLAGFIARMQATPFAWGGVLGVDCLMQPADWSVELGAGDPAAPWRGTYTDEAGARTILEDAGGFVPHMARALEPIGWRRVAAPELGDIAAIEVVTPKGRDLVGAIRNERFWIVRAVNGGVGLLRAEAVAVWTWGGGHG